MSKNGKSYSNFYDALHLINNQIYSILDSKSDNKILNYSYRFEKKNNSKYLDNQKRTSKSSENNLIYNRNKNKKDINNYTYDDSIKKNMKYQDILQKIEQMNRKNNNKSFINHKENISKDNHYKIDYLHNFLTKIKMINNNHNSNLDCNKTYNKLDEVLNIKSYKRASNKNKNILHYLKLLNGKVKNKNNINQLNSYSAKQKNGYINLYKCQKESYASRILKTMKKSMEKNVNSTSKSQIKRITNLNKAKNSNHINYTFIHKDNIKLVNSSTPGYGEKDKKSKPIYNSKLYQILKLVSKNINKMKEERKMNMFQRELNHSYDNKRQKCLKFSYSKKCDENYYENQLNEMSKINLSKNENEYFKTPKISNDDKIHTKIKHPSHRNTWKTKNYRNYKSLNYTNQKICSKNIINKII